MNQTIYIRDSRGHWKHDAAKGSEEFALLKALAAIQEGGYEEPAAPTTADLAARATRGTVLSQHDDWMHRGDHPIVRDMSLYVYSLWVYRVELSPYSKRTP